MKEEINITREQFFNFVKGPEDTKQRISPATQHYLDYFDHYQKTGKKGNWNWATLGGIGWFFYRRMYAYGIILSLLIGLMRKIANFLFSTLEFFLSDITVAIIFVVCLIIQPLIFMRYADYIYLDHAKNQIINGYYKGGVNMIIGIPLVIFCWILGLTSLLFSFVNIVGPMRSAEHVFLW